MPCASVALSRPSNYSTRARQLFSEIRSTGTGDVGSCRSSSHAVYSRSCSRCDRRSTKAGQYAPTAMRSVFCRVSMAALRLGRAIVCPAARYGRCAKCRRHARHCARPPLDFADGRLRRKYRDRKCRFLFSSSWAAVIDEGGHDDAVAGVLWLLRYS